MAAETPVHVFIDAAIVERMDAQQKRFGWSRKEIMRRMLLDALPRLEAAPTPLEAKK